MYEGLVRSGIRFVVVGGVAARAQGSVRVTRDLDICYDTAPDNVAKLITILNRWNARLRLLRDEGRRLPFTIDARTFRESPILTLQTDLGRLDLLDRVTGIGDYRAAMEQAERIKAGPVELHVLTLDALIAAKRATGRERDREHLIELEALRALRKDLAKARPRRARSRRSR